MREERNLLTVLLCLTGSCVPGEATLACSTGLCTCSCDGLRRLPPGLCVGRVPNAGAWAAGRLGWATSLLAAPGTRAPAAGAGCCSAGRRRELPRAVGRLPREPSACVGRRLALQPPSAPQTLPLEQAPAQEQTETTRGGNERSFEYANAKSSLKSQRIEMKFKW